MAQRFTLSVYGVARVGRSGGTAADNRGTASSLNGANAKRSTLSIEYRTPGGGAPEAYGLAFRSAWIELTGKALTDARLEISGTAGVLLSETAGAMPAKEEPANGERAAIRVMFFYPRNLRDDPLPRADGGAGAGETLSLKLTAADGGVHAAGCALRFGYAAR